MHEQTDILINAYKTHGIMRKCEWKSKASDESPQQLHWMWMEQEYYLLFSWRRAQVSHLALYTGEKKASQPVIQSITNYLKFNPLLHTGVFKYHVNHDNTCIQKLICLYGTGRQWHAITTGIEFTLFWIDCEQTCQSRSWALSKPITSSLNSAPGAKLQQTDNQCVF